MRSTTSIYGSLGLLLQACTWGFVTDEAGSPVEGVEVSFEDLSIHGECRVWTTRTRTGSYAAGAYAFEGHNDGAQAITPGLDYVVRIGEDFCDIIRGHSYPDECDASDGRRVMCKRYDFMYRPTPDRCDEVDALLSRPERTCGMNFYYGSLHGHTNVSSHGYDVGPGALLHWMREGVFCPAMDFFSITDHAAHIHRLPTDEWEKIGRKVNKWTEDGRYVALRGFEWTSHDHGHINGFDNMDYTSARWNGTPGLNHFYEWLDDHNAIGIFNHPEQKGGGTFQFRSFRLDTAVRRSGFQEMVGLATASGKEEGNSNARGRFFPAYIHALDTGWRVAPTGDQDHAAPYACAPQRTVIVAPTLTRASLLRAMRARRFYSTDDHNTRVVYRMRNQWMGSVVRVESVVQTTETGSRPEVYPLTLDVIDDEPIDKVELYSNNGTVLRRWEWFSAPSLERGSMLHIGSHRLPVTTTQDGSTTTYRARITVTVPFHTETGDLRGRYFFFRITGTNRDEWGWSGEQVTVTAPIWFR